MASLLREEHSLFQCVRTDAGDLEIGILGAIIKSDIKGLRTHHSRRDGRIHDLLKAVERLDSQTMCTKTGLTIESQAANLNRALIKLVAAMPSEIEVFDLGPAHVERAILRWRAAHKSKFFAQREKLRDSKKAKVTKRIKLDPRSSRRRTAGLEENSDVDQGAKLYQEKYDKRQFHDYEFMGSEAEDSDVIVWSRLR